MISEGQQEIFEVPYASPLAWYADESGRIDTNPSRLATSTAEMDEAAVFSVLQFGAMVPPLAPWRGIRRLIPGYRYAGAKQLNPIPLERPTHIVSLDAEQQADETERLLDKLIARAIGDGPDPIVLFSGGVDSSLLAARLVQMGRRDTLLVHHSLGKDDPESHLAEALARHLGLRFERLNASHAPRECLDRPAKTYSQPFANRATVPTLDLPYEIVERLSSERRPILDGTGADGAFGLQAKLDPWLRLLKVPRMARRAASHLYDLDLWQRNGEFEHLLRTVRRSATMPPLSAIVAQNPLGGIFYDDSHASTVHRLLREWIDGWNIEAFSERVVAVDMTLTCAGVYLPGSHAIYTEAGLDVHYPFLENEMLALALTALGRWDSRETKAPLKRALARHVPREMVYRTKSPFGDPAERVFHEAHFIDYLRDAAQPSSPIASLLRSRPIIEACDLLSRGARLPRQTLACLWAITFIDRWYRTADRGAALPTPAHTDSTA